MRVSIYFHINDQNVFDLQRFHFLTLILAYTFSGNFLRMSFSLFLDFEYTLRKRLFINNKFCLRYDKMNIKFRQIGLTISCHYYFFLVQMLAICLN